MASVSRSISFWSWARRVSSSPWRSLGAFFLAVQRLALDFQPVQNGGARGLLLAQGLERVGDLGLGAQGGGFGLGKLADGAGRLQKRGFLRRHLPGWRRSIADAPAWPRICAARWRFPCSAAPAAPAASGSAIACRAGPSRPSAARHCFLPPLRRSSASWRRPCRPAMPAASSMMRRRSCGLELMISLIWPWRTSAWLRAPVAASANSSCTSRARTSLPLTLVDRAGLALDAAGDVQRVAVVEFGGRAARVVVERDGDFGHVARRAQVGAGEDDVVHRAAAHVLV